MATAQTAQAPHDPSNPTIFIVDDDAGVREYLRWLIDSVGLNVETFPSARAFLDAYDPARSGCLLLDLRMPGMNGLELQSEIATLHITIPIIMMTGYAEVPTAVRAMKNGAVDFIQKPFGDQALLDRIQEALAVDRRARQSQTDKAPITARLDRLTPRQREVLDGLLAGKPSKIIASELGISQKTVDVHRSRLMRTMGAQSLPDLFRLLLLARGGEPAA